MRCLLFNAILLLSFSSAYSAKLSIVIDDIGYQTHQDELILKLPKEVSIAVLPDAPNAKKMAELAHQLGHEVLIHLPMAPTSHQVLEKNTLLRDMPAEQIANIIEGAIKKVPYATGVNNHMGSSFTSNLDAMKAALKAINRYPYLYFLDSMTTSDSQTLQAAQDVDIKVMRRHVFLDNSKNESDIEQQLLLAINTARKNGFAIAIGHPHSSTIRVLEKLLATLPSDIVLVSPRQLLDSQDQSYKP